MPAHLHVPQSRNRNSRPFRSQHESQAVISFKTSWVLAHLWCRRKYVNLINHISISSKLPFNFGFKRRLQTHDKRYTTNRLHFPAQAWITFTKRSDSVNRSVPEGSSLLVWRWMSSECECPECARSHFIHNKFYSLCCYFTGVNVLWAQQLNTMCNYEIIIVDNSTS